MVERNSGFSQRSGRRTPGRSRQRGVSAIVVTLALLALVPMTALSIDVGRIYYAQRDLQKLATLAALDASRVESGCYLGGNGTPGSLDAAKAVVTSTLSANGVNPKDTNNTIVPTVEFGRFDYTTKPGTRVFQPLPDTSENVTAVRVTLQRTMPTMLVQFIKKTTSDGILQASASAQHAAAASFNVGSTLLNIDSTKSMALNALLPALLGGGSALSISAAGYQGLANANVTIGDLATALGVDLASPGSLLTTRIPAAEALAALANTLGKEGQTAAASTINTIAGIVDPSRTVLIGDLLGSVENGADQLVGALPLNTLALLNSLAESAGNGLYPIKVPNLGVALPAVKLTNYLTVLEPQQPGSGRPGYINGTPRTQAQTAQIRASLRATLDVVGLATVKLGTDITVASAKGALAKILCPTAVGSSPSPKSKASIDAAANIATVTIGSFSSADPSTPVTSGSLIGVGLTPLVGVQINLANPATADLGANTGTTLQFSGPPFNLPQTAGSTLSVGNAVGGLLGSLNIQVCTKVVVSICLPLSTSPLKPVLQPALNTLSTALDSATDTLLNALGVEVGSVTVTLLGVDFGNNGRNLTPSTTSVPSLFTQEKPGLPPTR